MQLAGSYAARVHEVRDEGGEQPCVAKDGVEVSVALLPPRGARHEQLGEAVDGGQGRAELVGHQGDEFILQATCALGVTPRGPFTCEERLPLACSALELADVFGLDD